MLVLARKFNEEIIIEDNVIVKIVDIRGDRVRIGIEAPRETPILRGELKRDSKDQKDQPPP